MSFCGGSFCTCCPRGFVRIRHFGFFAHRRRAALLPLCFALLGQTGDSQTITDSTPTDAPRPLWLCPQCGGAMAIVERFTAVRGALPLSSDRNRNDHDLLFVISNLSRAGTPAGDDCPSLRHRTAAYRAILQRRLFVPRMRPSAPLSSSPAHQQRNSKRITPQAPNRLTSSRSIENAPAFRFRARARSSSRRSVSDTALGLHDRLWLRHNGCRTACEMGY